MSTDTIIRLQDVLEAVGNEPMVLDDYDMVQVQERIDWNCTKSAIDEIKPLPFGLHELTEDEIKALHGDRVIISAPGNSRVDKKMLNCWGGYTDKDGRKYVVLDGRGGPVDLYCDDSIKLYSLT